MMGLNWRSTVWILLTVLGAILPQPHAQEVCMMEGSLRLEGLASTLAGRVEVCHNGVWGTICADSPTTPWSEKNAQVVCRQLGFSGALNSILQHTLPNSARASADTPIHYHRVVCNGTESTLQSCRELNETTSVCSHVRDVAITCRRERRQQDIRLVGDTANGHGVVELFDTIYRWVTICPSASVWGEVEANASCMQLGYESGTPETYSIPITATGERRVDSLNCGIGDTLQSCQYRASPNPTCSVASGMFAGVRCQSSSLPEGSVRLSGSSSSSEGRVEVLFNGRWGTVCRDAQWSFRDGDVTCRQVEQTGGNIDISPLSQYSGESRVRPIWLAELSCSTTSSGLAECPRALNTPVGYAPFCPDHSSDAAVDCASTEGSGVPITSAPTPLLPLLILFLFLMYI